MDLLWHKSSSASGPNIQTQIRTYFTCYHMKSPILAESPPLADSPNNAVGKWLTCMSLSNVALSKYLYVYVKFEL